ncbi:MAG: hypothetical protein GXZ09_02100 [Syntrophomonadaceae bacterium]|jgi:hypothetical protein|nr:hypothetical protein [Syntrophomonadaceae bacterium]
MVFRPELIGEDEMSVFYDDNNRFDEEKVEQWAEEFFGQLMNIFNGFFAHVDLKETAERMKDIPFESMVLEQLAGESDEVKMTALRRIKELVDGEIEYLMGYLGS